MRDTPRRLARIKTQVWQDWLQDWTALLDARMPVMEALQSSVGLLGDSRPERILKTGLEISLEQIRQGRSLLDSLLESGLRVPPELQLAIACGERTGLLQEAIRAHAARWRQRSEGQTTLSKSLVYPCFVLILACTCWAVLDANIGSSAQVGGSAIPNATEWRLEDWLLALPLMALPLLAGLGWARGLKRKQQSHAQSVKGASINASVRQPNPWDKGLRWSADRSWHLSDFFFALGQELSSGLDLLSCLKNSQAQLPRWYLGRHATLKLLSSTRAELIRCVQAGRGIHQAFQATGAPAIVLRQTQMAEHTGELGLCCLSLARIYEIRALRIQRRLQSLIPPAILMCAAAVLALASHSTLLPLYSGAALL